MIEPEPELVRRIREAGLDLEADFVAAMIKGNALAKRVFTARIRELMEHNPSKGAELQKCVEDAEMLMARNREEMVRRTAALARAAKNALEIFETIDDPYGEDFIPIRNELAEALKDVIS